MKSHRWTAALLLRVAATLCLSASLHAETIVAPNVYDGAPAIGPGTSVPFNQPGFRLQQIYYSSQFSAASGDVMRISAVRFRVDEQHPVGSSFSALAQGVGIFMATTTRSFETASQTFDENFGTQPFEALPISDFPLIGQKSSLTSFDVVIPLPRSYDYDRRSGNLLLDIHVTGGASLPFLDQQVMLEGATFTVGGSTTASTGTKARQGLITQFEYTVVPEPGVVALFGTGVLLLLMKPRRR